MELMAIQSDHFLHTPVFYFDFSIETEFSELNRINNLCTKKNNNENSEQIDVEIK